MVWSVCSSKAIGNPNPEFMSNIHQKPWMPGMKSHIWVWDHICLLVFHMNGVNYHYLVVLNFRCQWSQGAFSLQCSTATVNGRNPAPVDTCRLFDPWFIGFQHASTIQGGAGFLPSVRLHFLVTSAWPICLKDEVTEMIVLRIDPCGA